MHLQIPLTNRSVELIFCDTEEVQLGALLEVFGVLKYPSIQGLADILARPWIGYANVFCIIPLRAYFFPKPAT